MTPATLLELRRQKAGRTLFVIPGAGALDDDLRAVVAALEGRWEVQAVDLADPPPASTGRTASGGPGPTTSVEDLARRAAAAIQIHQPNGPYRLLGAADGGLVALETAALLRRAGQAVAFTGLLDTDYDERFRPRGRGPIAAVTGTARRLGRVDDRSPQRAPTWAPTTVDGPVALFTVERVGGQADRAAWWRPWIADLDVRRVVPAVPSATGARAGQPAYPVAALARAITSALGTPDADRPPRVLLATSFSWITAARLAVALAEAGFVVETVSPARDSLGRLGAVSRSHRLQPLAPLRGLRQAIEASAADLIIPFDDRTRQNLGRLYAQADPATADGARLRERLEYSLGPADTYPRLYSRAAMMAAAADEGLLAPATVPVRSLEEVLRWLAASGTPGVLKTDGSWGGRGVHVVATPDQAERAWRRLSALPGPASAAKRLLLEGDPWSARALLTRQRPNLSIQTYVDGRPGNAAVACVDGKVVASVQAEVVRSDGPTGPATVLRVIEHQQITQTVQTMVRRLRLTGLCGFDFILDPDGRAHLIELNPRATPTSHLLTADGTDPLCALRAGLTQCRTPRRREPYPGGLVALFPQEARRDPASAYLTTAHHDVPADAPDYVAMAQAGAGRVRTALDAVARRIAARRRA